MDLRPLLPLMNPATGVVVDHAYALVLGFNGHDASDGVLVAGFDRRVGRLSATQAQQPVQP